MADLNQKSTQFFSMLSMKENHLITIENFIEKYLPIKVLTQITEAISSMYSDKTCEEMRKLNIHSRNTLR